jgi:Fe-S oxidoreductase
MRHPESCTRCGACVAVCPVEKAGGHAVVTFLADPERTDYSVWLCTSCRRCEEVCPEGIEIYRLMMSERRRERPPEGYRAALESLLACGAALEVPQEELDGLRAGWGLERVELPPAGLIRRLLE